MCFDVYWSIWSVAEVSLDSCKDCITAFLANLAEKGEQGRCPTCSHSPVQEADLLEVMRKKQTSADEDAPPSSTFTLRRNDFRSSTKLDALIQNLSQ